MTLDSADIRNKQFALSRKGYLESEVDDFLDSIIEAIDERDSLIEDLRSAAARGGVSQAESDGTADSNDDPPSSIETVTRLLSLAELTAQRHVAAAQATAEAAIRAAEMRAQQISGAAEAKAADLLADAQAEHRQVLGNLRYEQHRLDEALQELQVARSQARSDLEQYLTGLLVKVQESADGAGPSIGQTHIRALSA